MTALPATRNTLLSSRFPTRVTPPVNLHELASVPLGVFALHATDFPYVQPQSASAPALVSSTPFSLQ
eukprot:4844075-Pyramimonas_sp.AAC.1